MSKLTTRALWTSGALLASITMAQAETVVLQPGPEGKDAYIHSVYPTSNGGNHPMLFALAWTWGGTPGTMRSLVQFDLSGVPADAVVANATLWLYGDASDGGGTPGHSRLSGSNEGYVRRVTSAWDELAVTWNTQPATTTADQVLIPASTSNTQSYALDVTNMVRSMVGANYGMMIQLATEQHYRALKFSSSDAANAARRPRLEVTWAYRYSTSMHYTPYASDGVVNASWPRGLLMNLHRLYMQPLGGSWRLLYEGPSPAYTLTGLTDGRYRFGYRSRSALLGTWTDTRIGSFMTARRRPSLDVPARFPQVVNARQKSAVYQAQTPSVPDGEGERHWLGQGFDTMTGETRRLCLDTTQGLSIVTNVIGEEDSFIDIVQTNEQLAEWLGLDATAKVSATYSGFSGSASAKVKVFRSLSKQRAFSTIIAKFERNDHMNQLTSRSVPLYPDYLAMLDPSASTRDNRYFHYECGDEFIHAVDMGVRGFLLVTFDSSTMTETQLRQTSWDVQARFAKASVTSSGTFTDGDISFFSSIHLQIQGHSEGGPTGVLSGALNYEEALPRFRQFIEAATPETYVAINKHHILYETPREWLGTPYYTIFADPRTVNEQLKTWINVDYQVLRRCEGLEQGNEALYQPSCFSAKEKLETQIANCAEGVRWPSCVQPAGSSVLASLQSSIPAMADTVATSVIPYFYVADALSEKCDARTAQAALPNADCILDRTKTYTPLNPAPSGNVGGEAYGVFITTVNNPGGGGASHQVSEANGVPVLDSRIEVCAKNWWGGGAWYEGYQELYGKCPAPGTPFILE